MREGEKERESVCVIMCFLKRLLDFQNAEFSIQNAEFSLHNVDFKCAVLRGQLHTGTILRKRNS